MSALRSAYGNRLSGSHYNNMGKSRRLHIRIIMREPCSFTHLLLSPLDSQVGSISLLCCVDA